MFRDEVCCLLGVLDWYCRCLTNSVHSTEAMKLPVIVVALLLCLCPVSQSLDYCVVPDTGDCDDCPLLLNNAPCNTLQYYANNSNFTSNSIFHFLVGEHTLSTVVEVTNVTNLTLVGVGPHQNLSKVQCNGEPYAGFEVRNYANFSVENLSFYVCKGLPHTYYILINMSSTFYLSTGSGLTFDRVIISSPFSIVAVELQGHSFISNSPTGYRLCMPITGLDPATFLLIIASS